MLHSKDCVPQVKVTSTSHWLWGAKKAPAISVSNRTFSGKKPCTLRIQMRSFKWNLPLNYHWQIVGIQPQNKHYSYDRRKYGLINISWTGNPQLHSGSVSFDSLQHLASSKNSPMERSVKNHAEVAKTTESRSPVSTWPNRGFIRVEGTNPSSLGFGWPGAQNGWFQGV